MEIFFQTNQKLKIIKSRFQYFQLKLEISFGKMKMR